MPNALIVQPPLRDFYTTPHRFSGLGLEAVRRVFRANGWQARVRIFPVEGRPRVLPLPDALQHLAPHLIQGETGPARFFTHYRRFGPDFSEAARAIMRETPDLVVIGCFAFAYADDTIELARYIRKLAPRIPIITGGAGVTVFPEYFRKTDLFEAVLPGDAETALAGWLSPGSPTSGRLGSPTSGRKEGRTTGLPAALDPHPEPVWTQHGRRITAVFSRGCPKRCRFCSQFLTQGRVLRTASMDTVDEMITRWPEGIEEVNIEDDNLLLVPDFFFAVLDRIRSRFPNVGVFAENGIDYTLIDPENLERLFASGFRVFNLSVGSIHAAVLRAEERPADLRRWEEVTHEIDRRGGTSTTYFICGLEDDSPERTATTLVYLSRFPTRPGISLFYPVPGLPGFTDRSLFSDGPSSRTAGSSAWPWTGSLTTAQMVTAFRLSRLIAAPKRTELFDRCVETRMLWAEVRDHGKTRLVRVPEQDETLSRAVLEALAPQTSG